MSQSFFVGQTSDVKFNAMVAGDIGSGKTTFIQSFAAPFVPADHVSPGCSICFVEAPEYNEYASVEMNALELKNMIVVKHDAWIYSSTLLVPEWERNAADDRIHCLFYFFGPHRIRVVDRVILQNLAGLVPIVPVIAKADSLTDAERAHYLNEVHALMQELGRDCALPVMFDFQEQQLTQEQSAEEGESYLVDEPASPSTTSGDPQSEGLSQSYIVPGGGDDRTATGDLPDTPYLDDPHTTFHDGAGSSQPQHQCEVPRLANIFAVVCSASESGLREYPWGCSVSAYDERVSDFRRLQRLVFEQGNIARLRHLTQSMTIAHHQQRSTECGRVGKQGAPAAVQSGVMNLWFSVKIALFVTCYALLMRMLFPFASYVAHGPKGAFANATFLDAVAFALNVFFVTLVMSTVACWVGTCLRSAKRA